MKPIGGFFELELPIKKEFHKHAIRLNSARNCFWQFLNVKKPNKVYLPLFTCDAVINPLVDLNIEYEFYKIDSNLDPNFDFEKLDFHDLFVYNNYMGLKDKTIEYLKNKLDCNLIIDNAQSFFSRCTSAKTPAFYSPRKFFGVPDGGYLYGIKKNDMGYLEKQVVYDKMIHLLKRIDISPETAYPEFIRSEEYFDKLPVRKMSDFTKRILNSINYNSVKKKRRENFEYLHENLFKYNDFPDLWDSIQVPLSYPIYIKSKKIHQKLLDKKIYTPKYWPNVTRWANKNTIEYDYSSNLLHLPIDQRYRPEDLSRIVKII
ncbi:hypothetical protein [Membranihabitans maritimus]|uniref:hypothetical protein n=1 Tax=Membranihabitans maritimus TaxID=2904244 RepID=UPI001F2E41B1|nr:hypothetical protein [Membranihabitans maritimus]